MKSRTQRVPTASDRKASPSQLPLIFGKASFDTHETVRDRVATAFRKTQRISLQHTFDITMPQASMRRKQVEADIQSLEAELMEQRHLNRSLRKVQRDLSLSTSLMNTTLDSSISVSIAAEQAEDLTSQVSTCHTSIRELMSYCTSFALECETLYNTLREQEYAVPDKQSHVNQVTYT